MSVSTRPRRQPQPLSLRKRLAFIAAAILIGCLAALLLAEGVLRLAPPAHLPVMFSWPSGYYVPSAGCKFHQSKNFPPTWMTHWDGQTRNLCYTNSLGMRDLEPSPAKPGQVRILCLGCSFTEGLGIQNPSQPYPRQLEQALRAGGGKGRFVVMNGGVVGSNSFQQVRHGLELTGPAKANVWLLSFLGGELGMWARNTYGLEGQYHLKWGNLWDDSHLDQLLRGRSAASLWLMDHSLVWRWLMIKMTHINYRKTTTRRPYEHFDEATRQALRQFKEAARHAAVRAFVVYQPFLNELDRDRKGEPSWVREEVRRICREEGVELLDPTGLMVRRAARDMLPVPLQRSWAVSAKDAHYNPTANRIFAESIATFLAPQLAVGGAGTPPAKKQDPPQPFSK